MSHLNHLEGHLEGGSSDIVIAGQKFAKIYANQTQNASECSWPIHTTWILYCILGCFHDDNIKVSMVRCVSAKIHWLSVLADRLTEQDHDCCSMTISQTLLRELSGDCLQNCRQSDSQTRLTIIQEFHLLTSSPLSDLFWSLYVDHPLLTKVGDTYTSWHL